MCFLKREQEKETKIKDNLSPFYKLVNFLFSINNNVFQQFKRLPIPYGNCNDDGDYRYDRCISKCKLKYFLEKCHCRPLYLEGKR